jgi:hypothetical protein
MFDLDVAIHMKDVDYEYGPVHDEEEDGQVVRVNRRHQGLSKHRYTLYKQERNGDIIKDTTPILQFWSEMQQTWHIYSQRPQNSETGINFFILFSTVHFRAPQKRRFLGTYSGHRALTSLYFLRATSVKLVHIKNFCLKGFSIS